MAKTVLFIAPSAYPLGGVQTWLDYLLNGIKEHGYTPALALTTGQHHATDTYLDFHPFKNTYTIHSKTGSLQGRINSIEQLLLKLNPNIIVVVNIVDVYQAVNNLRQRNKIKSLVISTIHGIHPGLIDDVKSYCHIIDAVISTNRLTQLLIKKKTGIDPKRSLYAPYGVPKKQPSNKPKNIHNCFTVAYVGRLEEDQKRISDLIQIFSEALLKIPNLNILIAGDGPEKQQIVTWVNSLDSSYNVKYLGTLNQEELVNKVYSCTDVLVLTSHWETGPIVAWEAMNHSITLVSSRYIGHVEEDSLDNHENCLLFDIGDVKGAVDKLTLAQSYTLREHLNNNSRLLIEDKYSLQSSIYSWVDCFNTVNKQTASSFSGNKPIASDKGRLSTLLGYQLGELLRKIFHIKFKHSSAGSEWPHCYSNEKSNSKYLLEYLKQP